MSDRYQAINVIDHRTKDYRKIGLSIALLLAAAAALIGGAFATFTDTVTAGPQPITSGKVVLGVGPTNESTTGATNIAAGDTIAREIDLNSTGASIEDKEITLKFSASPTSLLDTDPTNGLQASIKACTVAWTKVKVGEYTCTGGIESTVKIGVAEKESVASLETTAGALAGLKSLTAGGQDYLVFTLTLPSTAPGNFGKHATECNGTSGGNETEENLEGCKSTLTYTFQATQRAPKAQ